MRHVKAIGWSNLQNSPEEMFQAYGLKIKGMVKKSMANLFFRTYSEILFTLSFENSSKAECELSHPLLI